MKVVLILYSIFLAVGGFIYSSTVLASLTDLQKDDIDWSEAAQSELARPLINQNADRGEERTAGMARNQAQTELPTPATVLVNAQPHRSLIEKTALRMSLSFEPYRPSGVGKFGTEETLNYQSLPSSLLGAIDLRWLPFTMSAEDHIHWGGFLGIGYSRQPVPLVTAMGYRYPDVALNSIRYEGGIALGYGFLPKWNMEIKLGVGQQNLVQTSKSAEVVGTLDQGLYVGALDVQYYIWPKFAIMASLSHRGAMAKTAGSIEFDPLTVSGGFLVQVR